MLLATALKWAESNPDKLDWPGFGTQHVRWRIALDQEGRVLGPPTDLLVASASTAPRSRSGVEWTAPVIVRTSGVQPLLVIDKASYVLGPCRVIEDFYGKEGAPKAKSKADRASSEHKAYVELLEKCLRDTSDPLLRAVHTFASSNDPYGLLLSAPGSWSLPEDWSEDSFIIFSVDGRDPLSSETVREWWAKHVDPDMLSDNLRRQCMLCGQDAQLVRKFPQLKGIPGAQSSGVPLISFNEHTHEHYGYTGSTNAPMCLSCANKSHGALSALLKDSKKDSRHSRTVSGVQLVWWTSGPDEVPLGDRLFGDTIAPSDVAHALASPFSGTRTRTIANEATERFFAAALSGNSGRAVVLSWVDTTLQDVLNRLDLWDSRLKIICPDGSPPPVRLPIPQLVEAVTSSFNNAGVRRRFTLSLIEAALLGRLPQQAILQEILRQLRSGTKIPATTTERRGRASGTQQGQIGDLVYRAPDGHFYKRRVTQAQAALLKLVLLGSTHTQQEVAEPLTTLDQDRTEPAYRCGRLLSVLSDIQRAALGHTNANIVDRYYASASTSPSTSLPVLVRGAQPHLAKIRKRKFGWAIAYDKRITEILNKLDRFPSQLTMREQAEFALGFYHQRASDLAAARAAKERGDDEAPASEEDIPDTEDEITDSEED